MRLYEDTKNLGIIERSNIVKKTIKEHPTLIFTGGFIYITILGYFSSSKFLNYFNIKATDYFTFEDFVLSIIREGDLFLWLLLVIPISYIHLFWLLRLQSEHGKRVEDLVEDIENEGDIETLSETQKKALAHKVQKLKLYKIGLDSYRVKIKRALAVAPFTFFLLSILAAWQVANFNYLDVKTGLGEYVRLEVKEDLVGIDLNNPHVLLLRTANYTFVLEDKEDNSSAVVITNSNVLAVYFVGDEQQSS
jgi:hypothetical protein